MSLRSLFAALLLVIARPLAAGGWPEIPASVWQMKVTDPGNGQGAVFLDDEIRLGNRDTEYRLRIRILSEAGKAAAQLDPFPPSLYSIEGRTVYPDGRVQAFDSVKDFGTQTIRHDGQEVRRQILIPPGLTTDCVVDLHWTLKESQLGTYDQWGDYQGPYWLNFILSRDFPIRHKVVRLFTFTAMSSVLAGFASNPPKIEKESAYRVFTFENIPAYEDIPYSVPIARERPALLLYFLPSFLMAHASEPAAFWNDWAGLFVRRTYGSDLKIGSRYRAYLRAFTEANLPADPVAKAQAVLTKVQRDVLNIDFLTAEQAKARTKRDAKKEVDDEDLEEALSRGWTTGTGIERLVFRLFIDLNLKPRLVAGVDRTEGSFHQNVPSVFQFTDTLVAVPTASGDAMAWFEPSNLLVPPGVIPWNLQGTPALEVDPSTWKASTLNIPVQPAGVSTKFYTFDLAFDGEQEKVQARGEFLGAPLWIQRDRYYRLEAAEQAKQLKDSLQEGMPGFRIDDDQVQHAQDLAKAVSVTYTASRDLDDGRRVKVDPFPGLGSPLWIPPTLDSTRTTAIVLPYAVTQTSVSRIRLPEGWEAVPGADTTNRNVFGSISWTSSESTGPDGHILTVQLKEVVDRPLASATDYATFREFLGWMQQATDRVVLLQKKR